MKITKLLILIAGLLLTVISCSSPSKSNDVPVSYKFPDFKELKANEGLQNPFLKPDGSIVKSKEEWPVQREYLKAMLVHYQYGEAPPVPKDLIIEEVSSEEVLDGAGILDLFNIIVTQNNLTDTLHCSLYRPNKPGKFPVIIKNDRGIIEKDTILTMAFEMGYAISKYAREDLALDNKKFVRRGKIFELYPGYSWGAIRAWAWGYSLVINAFEMKKSDVLDLDKIVTTGHSRGGKTALAGGIFEERVAIAGPNSSGLGGTASARIFEPGVKRIQVLRHPEEGPSLHWWAAEFFKFADVRRDSTYSDPNAELLVNNGQYMPFDAHFNKMIMAPRGLHNAHATEDYWANPYGTELTHRVTKDLYKWLGVEDNIGLHWRPGGHAQNYDDWKALMDFADLYFFKKDNGNVFDSLVYPDAVVPADWKTPSDF